MRRWVFLFVPLLVAGCATWGQGGFDGGRSFDNRFDRSITPANVNQLHEVWKVPGDRPVIAGGYVYATGPDRQALVAYRETGCTGTGVPTCDEVWSSPGNYGRPATDGTSVFAINTTTRRLHVFGLDGTPKWTYTPTTVPNVDTTLNQTIEIDNGRLWLLVEEYRFATGTHASRLVALPAGGCGARSCRAIVTIPNNLVFDYLATEGVLLAGVQTDPHGHSGGFVYAYDPATGALRWRSAEGATVMGARDGRVYALRECQSTDCSLGIVYPVQPGSNCSGSPRLCTGIASFPRIEEGPVLTEHHTIVVGSGRATWYSNTCTGACTSIAQLNVNDIPDPFASAAAGGLVYSAWSPSLGHWRIYATDDSLTGCPGGTCTANWTTDAAEPVHALAVGNGRLYASENDGFVHVYAR